MVDLKKRTATLLDTKNEERRIVPLSTEAIRILKGIPRDRFDGKVWGDVGPVIFPEQKRRKRSYPDLFRHDRVPPGHPATRQACTSAVRIPPSRISGHPPFRSRCPSPSHPPPDPDGCGAFRRPWPRTPFPSLPGSLPGSQG